MDLLVQTCATWMVKLALEGSYGQFEHARTPWQPTKGKVISPNILWGYFNQMSFYFKILWKIAYLIYVIMTCNPTVRCYKYISNKII